MGFIRFETNTGFIFSIPVVVSRISRKNHYFYPLTCAAILAGLWKRARSLAGLNDKHSFDSQILWIKKRKTFWV